MAGKRYFWMKLSEDFFSETYVKALRRLQFGDSLVIVYLKMQLKSLKTEGILKYCGLLPDSISELAMALDEDENIVRLTIDALIRFKAIERLENEDIYITAVQDLVGSEGSSAERVRRHRQIQKSSSEGPVFQTEEACNTDSVTQALQCNKQCAQCNGEIEIELEIEKDIEIDKEPPYIPPGDGAENPPEPQKANQGERVPVDVMQERFNRFWDAYPKKRGKGAAEAAWKKLKPSGALAHQMLDALEAAKKCSQWQREGGQYIPYPSTWINQKRWEDDYQDIPDKNNQLPDYGDDPDIPDW